MMRRGLLGFNALATGAFLGVTQWGVYLFLSSFMASTAMVYLATTLSWMTGSAIASVAPLRGAEVVWLAAATLAYIAVFLQATAHPHDLRWLPVLLLAVSVIGAYAGLFFRLRGERVGRLNLLFLLENCGFIVGTIAVFLACAIGGFTYVVLMPLPLAVLAALTSRQWI